jgi:hypothetical protein
MIPNLRNDTFRILQHLLEWFNIGDESPHDLKWGYVGNNEDGVFGVGGNQLMKTEVLFPGVLTRLQECVGLFEAIIKYLDFLRASVLGKILEWDHADLLARLGQLL